MCFIVWLLFSHSHSIEWYFDTCLRCKNCVKSIFCVRICINIELIHFRKFRWIFNTSLFDVFMILYKFFSLNFFFNSLLMFVWFFFKHYVDCRFCCIDVRYRSWIRFVDVFFVYFFISFANEFSFRRFFDDYICFFVVFDVYVSWNLLKIDFCIRFFNWFIKFVIFFIVTNFDFFVELMIEIIAAWLSMKIVNLL